MQPESELDWNGRFQIGDRKFSALVGHPTSNQDYSISLQAITLMKIAASAVTGKNMDDGLEGKLNVQ